MKSVTLISNIKKLRNNITNFISKKKKKNTLQILETKFESNT